jgi:hypothetical protein
MILSDIRRYRAAEFPVEIEDLIHRVAMNSEISTVVVRKIKQEAAPANKELFKITLRCILLAMAAAPLSHIPSAGNLIAGFAAILILEWTFLDCLYWRIKWRDSYVASYLIRALEFGLILQAAMSDQRIRDGFAASIQRAATRFPIAYKKSAYASAFFAGQVRRQAKMCRNDILSLIPCLVTAGQEEVQQVNADLARVLIRTQLGFWYQTSDISRPVNSIPLRYAAWLAFGSFFKEKSIQVAIIAFSATVLSAILLFIGHR